MYLTYDNVSFKYICVRVNLDKALKRQYIDMKWPGK